MLNLLKIVGSRKKSAPPKASGPALFDDSLPMYKIAPAKKVKGVPEIGDSRFKPEKVAEVIVRQPKILREDLIPDLPDPSEDEVIMARLMNLGTTAPAPAEAAPAAAASTAPPASIPSPVPAHLKAKPAQDDKPKFAPREAAASTAPDFLAKPAVPDQTNSAPQATTAPRHAASLPIVPAPVRRLAMMKAQAAQRAVTPGPVRKKIEAAAMKPAMVRQAQPAAPQPQRKIFKQVMSIVPPVGMADGAI